MTLDPISAAVPADVKAAGPKAIERHEAAQHFEELLLERLTQSMVENTPLAEGPYADQITQAFAKSVSSAGGLGLTETLYRSMNLGEKTP